MGRHRSAFQRAYDPKPKLLAFCRLATAGAGPLRRALSFHPEAAWPEPSRVSVLHRSACELPFTRPAYAQALDFLSEHNVDSPCPSVWTQPTSVERFVALVRDVVVPGHRVRPACPRTGRQIMSDDAEPLRWTHARPSVSALRRIALSDAPTLVIPRMDHYSHLLTDVLMPLFFAVQMLGFSRGDRLNVVTSEAPVSLILAFVDALRAAGYLVRHVELRVHETAVVPLYLHATTHTGIRDWRFAVPEALDFARRHLLAALRPPEAARPKRIFLRRGPTRTRQIEGEDALAQGLAELGFVSFVGRWSNLAEQIALFAEAEVVVALHGAGMSNILFARPDALLVEIMAADARKTIALHWAASAGCGYAPVLGSPEGRRQCFTVDPQACIAQVQAAIAAHAGRVDVGREVEMA